MIICFYINKNKYLHVKTIKYFRTFLKLMTSRIDCKKIWFICDRKLHLISLQMVGFWCHFCVTNLTLSFITIIMTCAKWHHWKRGKENGISPCRLLRNGRARPSHVVCTVGRRTVEADVERLLCRCISNTSLPSALYTWKEWSNWCLSQKSGPLLLYYASIGWGNRGMENIFFHVFYFSTDFPKGVGS